MRVKKPLKKIETIKNIGIFCWSIIGLIIIVVLFFYILYQIRIAIIPLIIAAGIAYLLTPLVFLFQRKMRKIFAVTLSYIIFTAVIGVIFFLIIPLMIDQLKIFINSLPLYLENVTNKIDTFLQKSVLIGHIENLIGKEVIPKDTNTITQYLVNSINIQNINLFQSAGTFTRSIINIVITFIIGPLLGIYILKDTDKIRATFTKALPFRLRSHTNAILNRINKVAGRYIRGQILVSIIVGVLCTIVLLILRVDFAVLLGFIAGIFNLIPFLGPYIGAIPAALVAFFISPLKAVLVILLFIGVQQLDNYLISPNIMKYQVGVNPGIIIFSLVAAGAVFGIIGLLIAVPTVAIIQEILRYYFLDRKKMASR